MSDHKFSLSSILLIVIVALLSAISAADANVHNKLPEITLTQLEAAFSGNCPNQTMGEVISCKDALPYINGAIKKYGLKTRGQRAAYIATMSFEGGYLKYDHNLINHSQGTRSIMPATSLRIFVDANKDIQSLWPNFPRGIDNNTIVDVLINAKVDFEPGAWWTVSGPRCSRLASRLSSSNSSFISWEATCINGGNSTIAERAAIYNATYTSIL